MVALVCAAAMSLAAEDMSPEFLASVKATTRAYTELDKFFVFQYNIKDTPRKQKIYLRRTQDVYRSLKEYEIFGLVWEGSTEPTPEQTQEWMQKRFGVGGLAFERPSETQKLYRVRYRLTVPDNATVGQLTDYLDIVAGTSDTVEKEFNPNEEDKF